jgi:hypothetical protein
MGGRLLQPGNRRRRVCLVGAVPKKPFGVERVHGIKFEGKRVNYRAISNWDLVGVHSSNIDGDDVVSCAGEPFVALIQWDMSAN